MLQTAHNPRAGRSTALAVFAMFATGCARDDATYAAAELENADEARSADRTLEQAVRYTHQAIVLDLYRAYFVDRLQPEPLATPDTRVAIMFFEGTSGAGAIYSHSYDTSDGLTEQISKIYVALLDAWGQWGFETLLGCSSTGEFDVNDAEPCVSQGGTRQQSFGYVGWRDGASDTARAALWWSPERGVWILPDEVAHEHCGEFALHQVSP